ncbi:MAG TPA: tRNA (adenosine(37)-N6)-threonylcarbamoyltransferase complex dimerization subunit type 1 TsaB [Gemmatimonadota bacterium]|nr:tRNA (adenosine(37)-N6)-threonylcarbamoyltransferase complex dimerization subunit type 1 TsaB [Gemmatimonadota bacterium]
MIVLAIDTATDAAGVALRTDAGTIGRRIAWRRAFVETAPAAEALLAAAGLGWPDLEALAIPAGPGSFTGLRVGAAFALGLAETRGIALHAVPTLAAVAEAWAPPGAPRVRAEMDARRGRRYAAVLERANGGWRTVEGPFDLEPEAAARLGGDLPRAAAEGDGPAVAGALSRLVAADPGRWRLASPERLELVYVRPGVDPPWPR